MRGGGRRCLNINIFNAESRASILSIGYLELSTKCRFNKMKILENRDIFNVRTNPLVDALDTLDASLKIKALQGHGVWTSRRLCGHISCI
jgi:hypothetical protein